MGAVAKSLVQVGLESTPGVAVTAKNMMPGDGKFNLKVKFDQPEDHRGSYDAYYENIQTLTRIADFTVNGEYYPETALWVWLMAVNSTPTIFAVPALSPNPAYYGWVINPGDILKTATFEEFDGTASWNYPYSVAQKVELMFTPEKVVEFNITGIGQDRLAMGANPTSDGAAPNQAVTALAVPTDFPIPGATAKLTIDPLPSTSAGTVTALAPSSVMTKPTVLAAAAAGGGALPAGTFLYKITAFNDWGETEASNEATVTVTAGQKANLTWTAPTTGTATGYRIWRTAAGGASNSETLLAYHTGAVVAWSDDGATDYRVNIAATPPTTNSTTIATPTVPTGTASGADGSISPGTYIYQVTAFNQWGETMPVATSGVVVASTNHVALSWTASAGGTPLGYNIYRTAAGGAAGTALKIGSVNGSTTTYTDLAVGPGVGALPTANGTMQFDGILSNVNVLSAKFSLELGQKEIYTVGNTGAFQRVYRGRRKVIAECEVDFLSVNEYNNFRSFVYQVFQFTFTGKALSTTATAKEQLIFTTPLVYVDYTIDKSHENVLAKVIGNATYDPLLGYSHQVRAQCLASAVSAY